MENNPWKGLKLYTKYTPSPSFTVVEMENNPWKEDKTRLRFFVTKS